MFSASPTTCSTSLAIFCSQPHRSLGLALQATSYWNKSFHFNPLNDLWARVHFENLIKTATFTKHNENELPEQNNNQTKEHMCANISNISKLHPTAVRVPKYLFSIHTFITMSKLDSPLCAYSTCYCRGLNSWRGLSHSTPHSTGLNSWRG